MDNSLNLVAFDCGNSSIRTILCRFDGKKVVSELILQEPNEMTVSGGYYYWDMPRIFGILKKGLSMAAEKADKIDSAGICTWGVDFQLSDDDDFLEKALCYRNTIGEEQLSRLPEKTKRDMFYRTGILCDKINSIYMLRGMQEHMPSVMERAKKIFLVPDIFVYMFTGKEMNEPSELSTTQMLDVRTMAISQEQCEYAGVSPELFSEIGRHGRLIGNIKREILDEIGIAYDIPFVCVPSHDTACAVMAIPSGEEKYLFVSSGTWALIGAQCPEPVVNEKVLDARLTNETGAFGRTTLLRNSAGMFIVQRLKAEYENETGSKISWNDFTALADDYTGEIRTFDVNDGRLFNPEVMVLQICAMISPSQEEETAKGGYCWPEILASTYASLGDSYAETLSTVKECTKETYREVYIVGGGSKNAAINQRCADRIKMPVVACDMECSSVGNAVVQIAYFHPEYSYERLRGIIVDSLQVKRYDPKE